MDNLYGFTTTSDDSYFDRVAAEASEDTNFILTTERNTVADNGENVSIVAIRKNALILAAQEIPFEMLADRSLLEIFLETAQKDVTDVITGDRDLEDISGKEWVIFQGTGDDETVARKAEAARHEIRRINNVLNGRVIRVTVESY